MAVVLSIISISTTKHPEKQMRDLQHVDACFDSIDEPHKRTHFTSLRFGQLPTAP
jgi:hypothetical protein